MVNSFHKVVRGGVLFALGTAGATILQFLFGVIVIRAVAPSEFGLISIAYMISNILVTIALLGFRSGVPRFLAKRRGEDGESDVGRVAGTALVISFFTSLFFAMLQYSTARVVSAGFGKPEVQPVLEAFAWMVPPLSMIGILSTIFRGLENGKAKVFFEDISTNASRVVLLILVVILSNSFASVIAVYVMSVWIAVIAYLVYACRHLVRKMQLAFDLYIAKEIVRFSLPLLAAGIMSNVMTWTGTLALGYLGGSDDVALFSAPLRLVGIIPIPLAAMIYLYLPVATATIERGALDEVKSLYLSATKWSFLATLPLLLYFLIDAEFIVTMLFGVEYQSSANVLRVLTLGFSTHALLGPNGITLIAWGETKAVFRSTLLAAIMVILLSAILIPRYGGLGAAVSASAAYLVSNIFLSIVLYVRFDIHPFVRQYIRPILFVLICAVPMYTIQTFLGASLILTHLIIIVALVALVIMAPIVTRSMTASDIELVRAIEVRVSGRSRLANWLHVQLSP